jgi:hypothetical protein
MRPDRNKGQEQRRNQSAFRRKTPNRLSVGFSGKWWEGGTHINGIILCYCYHFFKRSKAIPPILPPKRHVARNCNSIFQDRPPANTSEPVVRFTGRHQAVHETSLALSQPVSTKKFLEFQHYSTIRPTGIAYEIAYAVA